MLTLVVIQGPDKGRRFELPGNVPQLIGRSSEALPISDNTVSRRHAELTPDKGVWWIRDLESHNGTIVNGAPIAERRRLSPGDEIRVGETVFRVGDPDHRPAAETVRLMLPHEMDSSVERTLESSEDSMILPAQDPSAAAREHLRVVYKLTSLTTQITDRVKLLESVMDLAFSELRPERGFIMLKDDDAEGALRPLVARHRTPPGRGEDPRIQASRTIIQHAVRRAEGLLSSNAMADPRFAPPGGAGGGDSIQRMHIRSAICSPIRFKDRTFGAIYLDSSVAAASFTPEQLALLNAIALHTGLALAHLESYQQRLHTERLAAMGETMATLSHSIKNIMQGMRGGADVVEMGLKKDDLKIARGGWTILRRNIERIGRLTLNMLAYSKQRTLEIELTPLGAVIEDCAILLDGQCKQRKIGMMLDLDQEMPPVPIDAHLMHQAILNLMTNALEAVKDVEGIVTVRTTYRLPDAGAPGITTSTEILVMDNGPGITPDRLQWIFEPFNSSKGSRGTGLGLAVTRRIVEDHGGRITVESAVGKGTTFRIYLPTDPGKNFDPAATAETGPIVDDLLRKL
jgi:two-component system NtrC family sensor kinase